MKHIPSILIVEDDPYISMLITTLLEDAQYAVLTAETGTAALAHVDARALDLVILDWMLPDTQGVHLCQVIKARRENTFLPVLMLTARGTLADRVAGLDAGADDYLTKPFDTDELLARVRALLRIRVAEVERSAALAALAQQHAELQGAYNQLRATQAQLVQTSKLAALGELVAGIAHELNNPLAIILGNAELLPELADEEDRRAVGQIIAGAQRARRVVRSLATFARYGAMEQSWFSPQDLVERVLDLRRETLRTAGIVLDVVFARDLLMLWVDGPQIQQALLNLLLNAEHALKRRTDPRIAIRVFLSTTPVDAPLWPPAEEFVPASIHDAGAVVFDLTDNGPGLPEQVRDRLFEPFVTTRPVGEGTGLGLATTYGIVIQHGGTVQVASAAGHGTTFRIALPIEQPVESRLPAVSRAEPANGAGVMPEPRTR